MANVFLSYDREDGGKAGTIAQALEAAGHSVWWDRNIVGGSRFSTAIEDALEEADAVVVLWSEHSIVSDWVRDEASVGRDSGRLVPACIDRARPPLGFRQYQTIDLSGRKLGQLQELISAIEAVGSNPPRKRELFTSLRLPGTRLNWPIVAAMLFLLGGAAASVFYWRPWAGADVSIVTVRAGDSSPASRDLARNLVVQLGALRSALAGSMRLVHGESDASNNADLLFQATALPDSAGSAASIILSDSRGDILWSKQFDGRGASSADLLEQIAFTSARVLGCGLQEASGDDGRLENETRQVFLNACAASADTGWDTRSLIAPFRQVTASAPGFRPAWAQLLLADINAATYSQGQADAAKICAGLRTDLTKARQLFPNMAEVSLAEAACNPQLDLIGTASLVEKAKSQDPDNPAVLGEHSVAMASVGRITDSLDDERRAAELDPLSPLTRSRLIRALAYAGHIAEARAELARAKQLWHESEPIRQAEFSIEFRYGDFEKAVRNSGEPQGPGYELYAAARKNPSDASVAMFLERMRRGGIDTNRAVFAIQALGEMKRIDELYALLASLPIERLLRGHTYVFFRPWLADMRHDPRFMPVAKRTGLLRYWQQSGHWPDFCREAGMKYDCRAEAARLK